MAVELNRATFKRLVQLYLLSILAVLAGATYETFDPTYAAFSTEFDELRSQYFNEISDPALYAVGALCVVGTIAHIAAAVALLSFRRWGRWMFWGSLLLTLPIGFSSALYPYWSSFWTDWSTFAGSGLFGMIVLLAYAREHGTRWFAPVSSNLAISEEPRTE
jgi:hypothetical protein